MNAFVSGLLFLFAVAWLAYLFGLRDKRIAFTLWFPLTAAAFFGTLLWLWAGLGLLMAPRGGGESAGWAALGAALILGYFLVCPIVLAISLWQRPKSGSYSLWKSLPIIVLSTAFIFSYGLLSKQFENQQLRLTILDAQKKPLSNVSVVYQTRLHPLHFSFPSPVRSGQVESGEDGVVQIPAPESHEVECTLKREGYASMTVRMDRALDQFISRQTWISWQFPPSDPKQPWSFHGGSVAQDVDSGELMNLTVYLPKNSAETIPTYAPVRIYSVAFGHITWSQEPANPRLQ